MQKDTLFNSQLSDREFGSYLLHVPSLLNWAGVHFPETHPQIDTYKFVQVEELLCAIERVFKSLTTEQALNILRSQPEHQLHPAVIHDNGQLARWLLGADAHLKWRKLIAGAVKTDELELLDFASKLPLSPQAATELLERLRDDNQSNMSATNSNDDGQIGEIVQAGDESDTEGAGGRAHLWHKEARRIANGLCIEHELGKKIQDTQTIGFYSKNVRNAMIDDFVQEKV